MSWSSDSRKRSVQCHLVEFKDWLNWMTWTARAASGYILTSWLKRETSDLLQAQQRDSVISRQDSTFCITVPHGEMLAAEFRSDHWIFTPQRDADRWVQVWSLNLYPTARCWPLKSGLIIASLPHSEMLTAEIRSDHCIFTPQRDADRWNQVWSLHLYPTARCWPLKSGLIIASLPHSEMLTAEIRSDHCIFTPQRDADRWNQVWSLHLYPTARCWPLKSGLIIASLPHSEMLTAEIRSDHCIFTPQRDADRWNQVWSLHLYPTARCWPLKSGLIIASLPHSEMLTAEIRSDHCIFTPQRDADRWNQVWSLHLYPTARCWPLKSGLIIASLPHSEMLTAEIRSDHCIFTPQRDADRWNQVWSLHLYPTARCWPLKSGLIIASLPHSEMLTAEIRSDHCIFTPQRDADRWNQVWSLHLYPTARCWPLKSGLIIASLPHSEMLTAEIRSDHCIFTPQRDADRWNQVWSLHLYPTARCWPLKSGLIIASLPHSEMLTAEIRSDHCIFTPQRDADRWNQVWSLHLYPTARCWPLKSGRDHCIFTPQRDADRWNQVWSLHLYPTARCWPLKSGRDHCIFTPQRDADRWNQVWSLHLYPTARCWPLKSGRDHCIFTPQRDADRWNQVWSLHLYPTARCWPLKSGRDHCIFTPQRDADRWNQVWSLHLYPTARCWPLKSGRDHCIFTPQRDADRWNQVWSLHLYPTARCWPLKSGLIIASLPHSEMLTAEIRSDHCIFTPQRDADRWNQVWSLHLYPTARCWPLKSGLIIASLPHSEMLTAEIRSDHCIFTPQRDADRWNQVWSLHLYPTARCWPLKSGLIIASLPHSEMLTAEIRSDHCIFTP